MKIKKKKEFFRFKFRNIQYISKIRQNRDNSFVANLILYPKNNTKTFDLKRSRTSSNLLKATQKFPFFKFKTTNN
jgi:hypothetical protein